MFSFSLLLIIIIRIPLRKPFRTTPFVFEIQKIYRNKFMDILWANALVLIWFHPFWKSRPFSRSKYVDNCNFSDMQEMQAFYVRFGESYGQFFLRVGVIFAMKVKNINFSWRSTFKCMKLSI